MMSDYSKVTHEMRELYFAAHGQHGEDPSIRKWYYSLPDVPTYSKDSSVNNGGSTDYYKLPDSAIDLQDLIEFKSMNFAQGNIFKAVYRCNNENHSSYERDLNKIIWFVQRELKRIQSLN